MEAINAFLERSDFWKARGLELAAYTKAGKDQPGTCDLVTTTTRSCNHQ